MINSFILAGVGDVAKVAYVASKHPEETMTLIGFLIVLFVYVLIAGAVGACAAGVGKFILNLGEDEVGKVFLTFGGITLLILLFFFFVL